MLQLWRGLESLLNQNYYHSLSLTVCRNAVSACMNVCCIFSLISPRPDKTEHKNRIDKYSECVDLYQSSYVELSIYQRYHQRIGKFSFKPKQIKPKQVNTQDLTWLHIEAEHVFRKIHFKRSNSNAAMIFRQIRRLRSNSNHKII